MGLWVVYEVPGGSDRAKGAILAVLNPILSRCIRYRHKSLAAVQAESIALENNPARRFLSTGDFYIVAAASRAAEPGRFGNYRHGPALIGSGFSPTALAASFVGVYIRQIVQQSHFFSLLTF